MQIKLWRMSKQVQVSPKMMSQNWQNVKVNFQTDSLHLRRAIKWCKTQILTHLMMRWWMRSCLMRKFKEAHADPNGPWLIKPRKQWHDGPQGLKPSVAESFTCPFEHFQRTGGPHQKVCSSVQLLTEWACPLLLFSMFHFTAICFSNAHTAEFSLQLMDWHGQLLLGPTSQSQPDHNGSFHFRMNILLKQSLQTRAWQGSMDSTFLSQISKHNPGVAAKQKLQLLVERSRRSKKKKRLQTQTTILLAFYCFRY